MFDYPIFLDGYDAPEEPLLTEKELELYYADMACIGGDWDPTDDELNDMERRSEESVF